MNALLNLRNLRGSIVWPPEVRKRRRDYGSGFERDAHGISILDERRGDKVPNSHLFKNKNNAESNIRLSV